MRFGQDDFMSSKFTFIYSSLIGKFNFLFQISLNLVPMGPIDHRSSLVQILAWCCQWYLTHWGRVTHICVGNLTIIGPDNGLSPGRRQAIIWTNAGILLIGPLGTDFSEIPIEIITFSFKKIHLKMSSAKMAAICLGLNELNQWWFSSLTNIHESVNRDSNDHGLILFNSL